MTHNFQVVHLDDWNTVANALVGELKSDPELTHVLLQGNLGAGKTTLVQYIVKHLRNKYEPVIDSDELVQSPTYSIVNEYQITSHQPVYHLDLYRLKNSEELIEAGILDILDSGHLCFVEWPDLAKPFLGNQVLNVDIVLKENGTRSITLYRL